MGGRFPTWLPNGFYFNGVGAITPRGDIHFAQWHNAACDEIQLTQTFSGGEHRWKLTADFACTQAKKNGRCLTYETAGLRLSIYNVAPEDALRVAQSVRRFT
jgi:hypothetical protein